MISALLAPIEYFIHTYKDEITALSTFVIAIFTAILGIFTVTLARSTRIAALAAKNSADAAVASERAYVFPGYDNVTFEGRILLPLVMTNSGRTPAIIKEVGYAFLERTELPESREVIDWQWTKIPYDWAIAMDDRKSIKTLFSPYTSDHVFVCYIRYHAIFPKTRNHTSWMGMHLRPSKLHDERIARAGGDTWNDWD